MAMKQKMRGSELIIGKRGELYHINISRKDGVPPRTLVTGDPQRVRDIAKFFDKCGKIDGERSNREYLTVWGNYKGKQVAVMGTGIGTDNIEIALLELHAVHEYDPEQDKWEEPPEKMRIIRFGTSGSPQKDIVLGMLGIGEHAIGLDNTGITYLHMPADKYTSVRQTRFTPGNKTADDILASVDSEMDLKIIPIVIPYVSTATPSVVRALINVAQRLGAPYETGIITSASGFFGNQGRQIGRASNILIPNLQKMLATINVQTEDGRTIRTVANEMESSALFRIAGEILGYEVATVCSVIANRAEGEFISLETYQQSFQNGVKVALEALVE
ncbi:MAG: hypothetical protein ABII22_05490 [Candidatus Micrarchaeota archaeon]